MNKLHKLFKPNSVAVIGASQKALRAGHVVMRNLLQSGFGGAIMPVTPRYKAVSGVIAYPDVASLPYTPDIAILCTNVSRNEQLLKELDERGTPFAIVISDDPNPLDISSLNIRVLGPNSLGIILPWHNFNCTFSPVAAKPGKIAFISQSAAVCTTVLDWANDKNIGFSSFISIGRGQDIDFADLLDYLSMDGNTEAILLYVDNIQDARRFMSAARAASRNRRILVLKAGRSKEMNTFEQQDGDTLDVIYDSAIRRTGMLRVSNTHELFAAVETLTHSVPLRGERLAIITNGGGPAVMSVDTLIERGGQLATLDDASIEQLQAVLPSNWRARNPIDLSGDATQKRYIDTINALMNNDCADAILIMHSPSAVSDPLETAQAVINAIKSHPRHKHFNILTNWSGEQTSREARLAFTQAGIPTYRTPESAVVAYMHLVEYRRNQKQLMETPTTAEPLHSGSVSSAKEWVNERLLDKNTVTLDTHQTSPLFKLFGFNVLPTWIASDDIEAVHMAENIGYPVAVKLRSPDIPHKSDVHGVALNLRNSREVSNAALSILDTVKLSYPSANVHGLLVQGMAKLGSAEELRISIAVDKVFGPVILLGQGGSEWNIAQDAVAALPPLNMTLARYLVVVALKSGKIRLQKHKDALDITELSKFLVRISQMAVELPEIQRLDIHPVLVSGSDLTILDADVTLCKYEGDAQKRLAIRPFPAEFVETVTLRDGQPILLRPILPEDEPLHAQFINSVSKEDLYKRFFSEVGEFNHEALANFTQIDYDREMAFVAVAFNTDGPSIIGVARALITPDNSDAEFAILVRSDLKGKGLGKVLMQKIISYCKVKGTKQMSGMTMPTNRGMLMLAQNLGFEIDVQFADGTADMVLPLN
ncbi:TPA: bifunctional acetate--CoA ligase family protein/GNAT family N-acetyltransferase [Vibrio alginolyticus]|uniref:bifunctional acetate--CoA ligase family protein/GNAT family N-acetyltransferase n=1 Tax=Vibrio TaxID=662 RepID=UPI001A8EB153|nr:MULTISPECIES: bifunctional acetate--CoA ligase family protein/GNAT family N-acetyltransferase [Vibrio]ELB2800369.1 bifunctional acetate--CoA ligase family protein/GNAT family N-acetyltransferase [Vibrio alginolyticus]MBO0206691.1 bifunctional acetate--CoA ligase family protein/GNAT family N-acetyltransferase [Vibrio sp. Vb0877]MBO0242419.1 bifunctional acetate--CoA ligase family protein/GNAT family N-acetyltransferase [Vibrio sp. Vb0592]MCG6319867.1 bifunctional acetate--CoA ligase family pr